MTQMRSKNVKVALIVLLTFLISAAGTFLVTYRWQQSVSKKKYESQLDKVGEQLKTNSRFVYVALDDIKAGEYLTLDNVMESEINSEVPEEYFITSSDLGKIAVVDIPMDMPITHNMCLDAELPEGTRELECNLVTLSSNLCTNDYVDVRIIFPNGEDYVVLAKKQIKNVSQQANNCFYWLTEKEILMLWSAILDANQIPGTKVYTVKYLQPTLQEASVADYPLNPYAIAMSGLTPNVQEAFEAANSDLRKMLEERLVEFLGEDVKFGTSMTWTTPQFGVDEDGNIVLDDTTKPEENLDGSDEDSSYTSFDFGSDSAEPDDSANLDDSAEPDDSEENSPSDDLEEVPAGGEFNEE